MRAAGSRTNGALGTPPVAEPFTGAELARDLEAVREWSLGFWRGLTVEELFAPYGDAWSAADHVRHLVKSNRPVATALAAPKLLLLLRFGWSRRPSRRYPELVATYRQALAGGVKAGRFSPAPLPPELRTAEQREKLLGQLEASLTAVRRALAGWSERALERHRLPHPALGPLTVREIAQFTIYHNVHHALGVAGRPMFAPGDPVTGG